jgi:DNA-binding transcriptional regulator YdaS (Cro superfamily)
MTMDSAALQKYLLRLFERHDIELEPDEDGWLVTDDDFPAIRALWHEGAAGEPGRLDVDVVLSEERRIEESFVGFGGADTGCRDALRTFEHNAFHLLLAACWYVTDDRRMRITAWDIGVRTWDVFIGPFTVRNAYGGEAAIPAEVITTIEAALKREALSPELHWLRLVHLHAAGGDKRCEALLDNEPWTAGTLALDSIAWPPAAHDYSARCFIMFDVRDY